MLSAYAYLEIGSNLPPFLDRPLSADLIVEHLKASRTVGVPYTDEMVANARADLLAQADPDADTVALVKRYPKAVVANFDGDAQRLTELDALIAYLQMLGTLVKFSDITPEQLRQ